jgi:hypothetical protein
VSLSLSLILLGVKSAEVMGVIVTRKEKAMMRVRELLDRMSNDSDKLAIELVELRHEKIEMVDSLTTEVTNLTKLIRVVSDKQARDRRTAEEYKAVEAALIKAGQNPDSELYLDCLYIDSADNKPF